jgi:hypothetical protein
MPVTVKFDPTVNSLQAQVISDATPFNDGVMSKAQAPNWPISPQAVFLQVAIGKSRALLHAMLFHRPNAFRVCGSLRTTQV